MKHQIKHRYTGTVLFEVDLPDDTPSGMVVRAALERATAAKVDLRSANLGGADLGGADLYGAHLRSADLYGADLHGANLYGANLYGADLYGADLYGADLCDANLRGANLCDANLYGANLCGADLRGANLCGADLCDANLTDNLTLIGTRPMLTIGPIGSRSDYLTAYITDAGVRLKAGCFFGTLDEFRTQLAETHGDNDHAREYRAALTLVEAHAAIWTPKG